MMIIFNSVLCRKASEFTLQQAKSRVAQAKVQSYSNTVSYIHTILTWTCMVFTASSHVVVKLCQLPFGGTIIISPECVHGDGV